MIFAYDGSRQALVYPHPKTGAPSFIQVKDLGAWDPVDPRAMETNLRLALPRFDRPAIEVANPAQIPIMSGKGRRR